MISPLSVAIGYPKRYNLDLPKLNLVGNLTAKFFNLILKNFWIKFWLGCIKWT